MSATLTRRPKWQYPPAPKIIYLPRRPRRRQKHPKNSEVPARPSSAGDRRGKLEALFDRERTFSKTGVPVVLLEYDEMRRERVGSGGAAAEEAEKWRFQAEMLRAECNFLRMEREVALKKLEKTRTQMQRTLRSTVQTLITGRNKIGDRETLRVVLDEEIQELAQKLEKLQRRSGGGARDHSETQSCSNFDKQACLLQTTLEKIGGTTAKESCAGQIPDMAKDSTLWIKTRSRIDESFVSTRKCNDAQLEVLKQKMEGLSKVVLLETMEDEYRSLLTSANSSVSTSKRIEVSDTTKETMCGDGSTCSGRCKVIVRRIVEQVRGETEQWSQMQEMLGQVREEMEEMRACRDFWEDRARGSNSQIQALSSTVQEWKHKALSYEAQVSRLQKASATKTRGLPPNETEKRVLTCRFKENRRTTDNAFDDGRSKSFGGDVLEPKRSLFRDIGNLSPQKFR